MRVAASDARIGGGIMLGAALTLPVLGKAGVPGLACPLLATTGVPCPLCGMTTSVIAAVHGDIVGALSANPFGLVAVATALWLLVDRKRQWLTLPSITALGAVALSWGLQLLRFSA